MSARPVLLGTAAAAAVLTILVYGGSESVRPLAYATKPAATSLLFALALFTREPITARYRALVSAGLACSLAGDVLLMFDGRFFLAGLATFLVAHLAYLAAFTGPARPFAHRSAVLAYAAVATLVLARLLPVLGGVLRAAVITYVVVIALMAAQAASWMLESADGAAASHRTAGAARLAALGASLFVCSDAALALDRFVTVVPYRDGVVLGTYWTAQGLIAASVRRPPPPTISV